MTDAALRSYVTTLASCLERHPDLFSTAKTAFNQFRETYAGEIKSVEQAAAASFERMYPGDGENKHAANIAAVAALARRSASAFAKQQCVNVINAFEGMAVANDFSLLVPRVMMQAERAKIPRC